MFIAVCPFIGIGLTPPYRAMEGETSVMHNQFLCVFSFCEMFASALIHQKSKNDGSLCVLSRWTVLAYQPSGSTFELLWVWYGST